MELEQRVKTLEQEIKILKGQIQRTLLDVQEQLLVHYHPSLRIAEAAAADELPPARPFVDPENDRPESKIPAPIIPQVQKVTLDDIRRSQGNGHTTPKPQPLSQPQLPQPPSLFNPTHETDGFTRLAEWVDVNVSKLGIARTRKLIELRLQSAGLKPDVAETLLQIVSLYEVEGDNAAAHETTHALQQLNQLLNM